MRLRDFVLEELANMVVGDNSAFPYRSSYFITEFFKRCELDYQHDGTTRPRWTADVLKELNQLPSDSADLPNEQILRVIFELFDQDHFDRKRLDREPALVALNELIKRQGLEAYFDETGSCYVRNTGSGISSSLGKRLVARPLSKEEIAEREKISDFLKTASEDEFTEKLLVPFFQRHGFHRVSPGGHNEKLLEFGKDLWMKYLLPTGHWIYFCAQIKKGKIDASGTGGLGNVTEILNQARMAIDNPIFDPDTNRKVLLDHIYIIAAGDITRPARAWIVEHLDKEQRRHLIFMDRAEFLDQSARILKDLKLEDKDSVELNNIDRDNEEMPF
ncbi:hypothetical protein KBI23_19625 [bacterium]|nr:hypothetical protein [bacterium]MBP9811266.1 hypothetical protein [bacterium]